MSQSAIEQAAANLIKHPSKPVTNEIVAAWPDPILPGALPVPNITADLLPSWVGDMAKAVAESTQTPEAMAVMLSCSVLATCLHRRFEVAPWGMDDVSYTEPLSLWTLTALGSGNRKTSVISALTAPLVHWEKLQRDRLRSEIGRVIAARAIAKKRIEKLTRDATNADDPKERQRIQKQIEEEQEAMPLEIVAPRLFTNDVTSERLQAMLVEYGERMAVLTDEAGIFNIMAGQYSGGIASLDVFLQGHAASTMRVDRAGRSAHVDKPALSFGLALQPGVMADVASSRRFRDSGLLARFLYAMPESTVGKRNVRFRGVISNYTQNLYHDKIIALLDDRGLYASAPKVIGMDPDAREMWLTLSEEIERRQGEYGDLESISDWSSKLPGAAARIACLFALAEHGVGARMVDAKSMGNAVALCRLLIPHAQAAFNLLGADAVDGDAHAVIKWLRTHTPQRAISRRDLQKKMEGRFRQVTRLEKAIERLEYCSVIRIRKQSNGRAPSTIMLDINPKLYVDNV